ncbi:MAG: hypothetical protein AAB536_00655 [Patescibacteria group bacterium]
MLKEKYGKLAASFLFFVIASFLQLNFKAFFGWSPEFAMAALVVFGFYLSVLEMGVLSFFGIFLFNWRVLPGWEILFFFLIPFFMMFARKIFPWRNDFNCVLGTVFSVFVFYAVFGLQGILGNPGVFMWILAATAFFGAAVFRLLNYFYKISPI